LSQWFKSFVIETPLPYVCFLPRVFTLKNYPDFYCEFYCPKLPLVFTPVFLPSELPCFLISPIFVMGYLVCRLASGWSVADDRVYATLGSSLGLLRAQDAC